MLKKILPHLLCKKNVKTIQIEINLDMQFKYVLSILLLTW